MVLRLLCDLLRERVAATPERAALLVESGRTLTYGDWDRRSDAVAARLAHRGVCSGDVVALFFSNERWDDYAVAYLAAHKLAAVAVPLSPQVAGPELGRRLAHCGAVGTLHAPGLTPELPESPDGWVADVTELEDGPPAEPLGVTPAPGDLAEIIYTSGTTEIPKGVACSHASIAVHDGPPEPDGPLLRLLHAFPIGTNASQEALRISLRRGDRLPIALDGFDPERCAVAIERYRVDRLQLVPATAQVLATSGAWRRHDLSSIQVVTLSSAPTSPALLARLAEAFPSARFVNTYALTESGTARTLNPDALTRPDSVGRPVGRTELQVVDDSGDAVPTGQTGRIWLRRPGAPSREYFRDPESTAAAFTGDWLRTGDLGWLDDEGELHLVGRDEDVIICGGLNVSGVEVEHVLAEHPAVVDAAVVGVPHEVLGQQVVAAVVTRGAVEPRELQALVRSRLAEHKTPHRITITEALPRTPSGKVRKRDLVATLGPTAGAPLGERPAFVAPSTPAEEAIATIWAEVLGVADVGVHDDFFERGGQSLAAAEVLARLGDTFGVTMTMSGLFEQPTVAELAAAVTRQS
ncbi:MAG: AMP-binding protein [Pseudonocardiaceae bacterium]|nr:AMP-binding protein [Pseudonocardiaceae bacterium]